MTHEAVPGHLWNARHKLELVQLTLDLRDPLGIGEIGIRARGEAHTSRHALWHYQETFEDGSERERGYSAADALHHIVLVCQQDRPNSLERVEFALRGGLSWSQEPML